MARTFSKADRPIHKLAGLDYAGMERLTAGVKAARKVDRKDKALRSIARECRLWFQRQAKPETRIYGSLISQQDGRPTDKLVVATI